MDSIAHWSNNGNYIPNRQFLGHFNEQYIILTSMIILEQSFLPSEKKMEFYFYFSVWLGFLGFFFNIKD